MMKKLFFYGMMSAFALTFVACSSEEELAPVNPTFDGKAVKTQFSLNIPGNYSTTRMQTTITQDGTAFRGIALANLFLAPYATPAQADANPVKVTYAKRGNVALTADITGFDHTNAQDKWYNDITVPIETNAFLVYAEATKSGSDAQNGSLTKSATDPFADLAALRFELKPIAADFNIADDTDGEKITDALTAISNAEGYPNDVATDKVKLSAVTTAQNQYYYDIFQNLKGLKAGSKTDVLAYLQNQLKPALFMNTGKDEGLDVAVAKAVDDAITAVSGVNAFPKAGLPDGAAVLTCTEAGVFSYTTAIFIDGKAPLACGPNTYVFPASLWYRANTGIRAADEIKSSTVGDQTWAAFIGGWANDKAVKSSTQSVALVNPLQYAVGNLETQIKFAKENYQVKTTVTTNESTGGVTTTETVEVKSSDLALNGILIGDQKNVDWQFMPASDASAVVIYDTDLIKKTGFAVGGTDVAYTIASQTLVCETAADKDVINVALEFINNSEYPINGVDGIVPVGAKFYLIGQLKLNKNWTEQTTSTRDDKKHIFEQDYKTIAKFLINDLKTTAYNTIPDLRSPELEFGLSVDLEWQKGYTFEIGIGESAPVTTGD